MKRKIGAIGALALALLLGACSGEVSYDWPEGEDQLFVSHIKEPVLTVLLASIREEDEKNANFCRICPTNCGFCSAV